MDDINLKDRSESNFLIYANSVIKSRAIPFAEDNLKPVHRRILWSMYESKFYDTKPTVKSAKVVGNVMGAYHPHGDSSIYEAMVRLSQWWKVRYPLIEIQGNAGNILGDSAAAMRYTEARLSKIGMLMLEDIDKECVEFKPNFDASAKEPLVLPSKFPYLLCGNNSGIAIGMSSDLVSHNYTEVMNAINFYLDNPNCSIHDLMQYIKGPDFPTGGRIVNGDELESIYTSGKGIVRIVPHYDIITKGQKTLLIFHDLPYGVEIDDGIKTPLKKLVLDDGYDVFEDIEVKKVGNHNFDIIVTLRKDADIAKYLKLLFTKTGLSDSIKINQTLIVNGEPKLLNLKQMIEYWVNYRSNIIKKIAINDYGKTNHKLTVTIGLQKCMSDIDKLISLIRNSNSRSDAKEKIIKEFVLNDEQAEAVLDMKLSRLSKLDLTELNNTEKELEENLAKLTNIIDNEKVRYDIIRDDLLSIKKVIGDDKRLTEICYQQCRGENDVEASESKKPYYIFPFGLDANLQLNCTDIGDNLIDVIMAYGSKNIYGYTSTGELNQIENLDGSICGAFELSKNDTKLVTVTKNGNIKVSLLTDYKFKKNEKILKLKEDDSLIYAASCTDDDYIMLFDGQTALKLKIGDLSVVSRLTLGLKTGFTQISAAHICTNSDYVVTVTNDNKGKITSVSDFSVDSRGNKGQTLVENIKLFKVIENGRTECFLKPKQAGSKMIVLPTSKLSIKSKTAVGASITNRIITQIV